MTAKQLIEGRRIGIVGMARSGMAAAHLVADLGGKVFVSDAGSLENLLVQADVLSRAGIPFETGAHTSRLLQNDFLVVSPGVPLTIDILRQAVQNGIPVFSEIEFASWVCRGRIIGVTGSNGKTTTTTLIGELLTAGGFDSHVCGNIGRPFSSVAEQVFDDSVAVVEISTFQLEAIHEFRPYASLILNVSPDHLDRHGDFESYKKLKYRIAENQTEGDFLIVNKDDAALAADPIPTRASRLHFTTRGETKAGAFVRNGHLYGILGEREIAVLPTADIRIPGPHNLQNAAAAVCVGMLFGVSGETMAAVLRSFPGVEHRLESVGVTAGVGFVNDSKATNVDAVCWALRSIDTPIHLIAGGRDKGAPYTPIINEGRGRIKSITVIGEAGHKIFEQLGKAFPTQFAESMEEAVKLSFDMAGPGDTVLLSPGCSSFDMYDNFEHRGQVFKAAVAGLKRG